MHFGLTIVISRIAQTPRYAELVPGPAVTALAEWQMQLRLWNTHSSKVRHSPNPFGPKSAGRSSFEQGRLGIVFLLDGPHPG